MGARPYSKKFRQTQVLLEQLKLREKKGETQSFIVYKKKGDSI